MQIKNFNQLEKEFGQVGSWAIWEKPDKQAKSNTSDMSVFESPNFREQIKTDLVFIGLNQAIHERKDGYKGSWANFHSDDIKRQNDFKLRYALMDTPYWGSYITDVIKSHFDTLSTNVIKDISQKEIPVEEHIQVLRRELDLLGGKPVLVALGGAVYNILNEHLADDYKIIKVYHYSHWISKENYREHLLEILGKELS